MRLSEEIIDEFKKVYLDEFKKELSQGEARTMAERFINLMEIVYRPIPGIDYPDKEKK
jgi:predicted translin family RNA/ssDNA-binding protein